MNTLLSTLLCISLFSNNTESMKREEDLASSSDQKIVLPATLDGCTLTMVSKKLTFVNCSYSMTSENNRRLVKTGKIKNYFEKNRHKAWFNLKNSPFKSKIIFTKNTWKTEEASGIYTCKKIDGKTLYIDLREEGIQQEIVLFFTTNNEGSAYILSEEDLQGNTTFTLNHKNN